MKDLRAFLALAFFAICASFGLVVLDAYMKGPMQ